MKKAVVAVLVVAAALAGLYSALRTSEGPIVMAFKYRKGQVDRYETRMTVKENSVSLYGRSSRSPSKSTVSITRRLFGARKDGSAAIGITVDSSRGAYGGGMPRMRITGGTGRVSKAGKPLETGKLDYFDRWLQAFIVGLTPTTGLSMGAVLPPHGVAVGQPWVESYPSPVGGGKVDVSATLVDENYPLGNRKTCKIESTYECKLDIAEILKSPEARKSTGGGDYSGEIKINGKALIYFSRKEGRIIKCDDKLKARLKVIMGRAPGAGGSSTGASMTMNSSTDTTSSTVLVEKPKNGGRRGVSPSP